MLKYLMLEASRVCLRPADDNGGGGGAGGADNKDGEQKPGSMLDTDALKKSATPPTDGQQPPATDPNKKPDDQKPVEQPGQKQARPDWLKDDKFWDAEKGEPRYEAMHKSFKELEQKFHKGDHKAPEKAEDYKINLADAKKVTLFGNKDADASKDPAVQELTKWAVENKIPQGALDQLLDKYADLVEPEVKKLQIDVVAEKAKLGKNADAVIKNQFDFLGSMYKAGRINDAMLDEARILMETAPGVQFLQALREHYGEQPIPTNPTNTEGGMPTSTELSAMLNDPKYDTDPDYKKKVDGLYDRMYGTQPAISSKR